MNSNKELLLSICIPTNGAIDWIIPTLESIYNQDCDYNLFEVVVTDNGINDKLGDILKEKIYPNLYYYRTKDSGFFNLITSLKKGNGLYCKMLNHRSLLRKGVINDWIKLIERYKKSQPIIYITDNCLKTNSEIKCKDLNEFVDKMTYWTSWSAGIGIWKKDKICLDEIVYNEMFPNLTLLTQMRDESEYLIYDVKYQDMQDESGKGGYNLFETFSVIFLDEISNLRKNKKITTETFLKVKANLIKFLISWYSIIKSEKHKYSFELDKCSIYIQVYYSKYIYLYIEICSYIYAKINGIKKFLKKLFNIY